MMPSGGRSAPNRNARRGCSFRLLFACVLLALAVGRSASATPLSDDLSEPRLSSIEASLRERAEAFERRSDAFRSEEAASPATEFGVPSEKAKEFEYLLANVRSVYSRSIGAIDRIRELAERREESRRAVPPPLPHPAPWSLSFLDEHLEKLDDLDEQVRENEYQQAQLREGLKEDADDLDAVRKKIRQAAERLGDIPEGSAARRKAEWELRFLKAEEEAFGASTEFYRLRRTVTDLERARLDRERTLLRERIAVIRTGLAYDEADLRARIARIDERAVRFAESAERCARLLADPGMTETTAPDGLRETIRKLEDQARQAGGLLNAIRETWERRYALLRSPAPEAAALDAWAGEATWWSDVVRDRLADRQRFLANLAARAPLPEEASSSVRDAIERGKQETLDYISAVLSFSRLQRRLLDEIGKRKNASGLGERLRGAFEQRFSDIRDIELWTVGDVPVTLGKLLQALLILLVGIPAGNAVLRFVKKRLYRRQRQDIHAALLLLRIAQYLFVTLLAFSALHAVRIPLTAFAFLGGAIVVGVGLGAQEFFRNLISGLVLMIEKPIRIHDIIEIDNDVAVVKEIDSRATHVLTFNGVDVFLPNSYFWENRIANRTFSSKNVKLRMTVCAAYGSPVREVERILLETAGSHPKILRDPAPGVTFADFAEHSLTFRLSFYLSQRDLLLSWPLYYDVMSDLRFALTDRLEAAGVEIVPTHRLAWSDAERSAKTL